jgi:hypothetical protein
VQKRSDDRQTGEERQARPKLQDSVSAEAYKEMRCRRMVDAGHCSSCGPPWQGSPPLSLHVGNQRKLAHCGRNIFWQVQMDEKQGLSSSIARSPLPSDIRHGLSRSCDLVRSRRNRNAARGPRGGKHFRFRAYIRANPCFIRDARRYAARSRALIFIQIFAGNIILRHLMRANFPLNPAPGVFHASHDFGLERVSFLDELAHTLRIRSLDVG